MIGHEGERKSAGKGNVRREGSREKVHHRYGESSEDQRNDPQISLGFFKGVEKMGEKKKERGVEESRVVFIEFNLAGEIIPRIIEGVNFIHPEGFLVKGVESQDESYKETEKKNQDFFSS